MSFPPAMPPNNPLFPPLPGFPAQAPVPPIPRFHLPLTGLAPPLPLSVGVTVPAGVASISAPPVRNPNSAVIAAPPIISAPHTLLFPPGTTPLLPKVQPAASDSVKKLNITTVFVGNITDRASDMLIRQLLSKCGSVHNWKRVQGPNGKVQAFGFCDYSDPESAMRAIRLLHEFSIGDKKLIVKADAKTQEKLDEYNKGKSDSGTADDKEEIDEEDKMVKGLLMTVLKEHETELNKEPDDRQTVKRFKEKDTEKNDNLHDLELTDDKRNLIHREIDKFRDTYKKKEEEKDDEKRKKDDERDRDRSRRNDRKSEQRSSRSKDRDERSRSRKSRDKDRRPNRAKSPSSDEDLDIERSDSPVDEEELLLRRRRQEREREKEISYQRRLRDWETRERRKMKDYERESQKEQKRLKEEEIEKQKLKQFLQDYDDYKHDEKYYSGKVLYQRQMKRRDEIEEDEYEREQERKELEELRKKLKKEGHPDPESELRRQFNLEQTNNSEQRKPLMNDHMADDDSQSSTSHSAVKTFGFAGMKIGPNAETGLVSNGSNGPNKDPEVSNVDSRKIYEEKRSEQSSKRKKLTVSEVFAANEDDDANSSAKKRRPPPNALLEDSNTDSNMSVSSAKPNSQLTQEEKKIQIKNLIDKIPTSKPELFNYVLDWDLLDNNLMERRIRPWIGRKIRDYIGEEDETLLKFICDKLRSKCPAQSLLDNVAMVLDDEAQVFVVKLWRLLIFEIEAKKLGLTKH